MLLSSNSLVKNISALQTGLFGVNRWLSCWSSARSTSTLRSQGLVEKPNSLMDSQSARNWTKNDNYAKHLLSSNISTTEMMNLRWPGTSLLELIPLSLPPGHVTCHVTMSHATQQMCGDRVAIGHVLSFENRFNVVVLGNHDGVLCMNKFCWLSHVSNFPWGFDLFFHLVHEVITCCRSSTQTVIIEMLLPLHCM